MKLGPRPASQHWTPEEDAQLLALLASGLDRPSIARKRTVHAIANRKARLNQCRPLELLKAKGGMNNPLKAKAE
jgi:hypothetical protein